MLSGDLVKDRAMCFAMLSGIPDGQLPSFSIKLLQALQKGHGFNQLITHGKSGSVNPEVILTQRDSFRGCLKGGSLADLYDTQYYYLRA